MKSEPLGREEPDLILDYKKTIINVFENIGVTYVEGLEEKLPTFIKIASRNENLANVVEAHKVTYILKDEVRGNYKLGNVWLRADTVNAIKQILSGLIGISKRYVLLNTDIYVADEGFNKLVFFISKMRNPRAYVIIASGLGEEDVW